MANITLRTGAFGISGWIKQPGERDVTKRTGIVERTTFYKTFGYPTGLPTIHVTAYPDQTQNQFVCDEIEVVQLTGGWYSLKITWVAILNAGYQYVTYESKFIQVPIEQSDDFIDIAGTPENPQNLAIFDANGQFIGFGPGSAYYGVVSVYKAQNLMVVRGSSSQPATARDDIFLESATQTLRGAVWEFEFVYNLDIDIETGIPT
jgi:hypothetical protein